MGNRGTCRYVNGTAALEISCGKDSSKARLIRVDFKKGSLQESAVQTCAADGSRLPSFAAETTPRRFSGLLPKSVSEDIAAAVKALGIAEIKDGLSRGGVAGDAACDVDFKDMAICCLGLLVFGLILSSF